MVILIGLSLMKFAGPWFILLPSITLFASAFILHELAHKFVAQSYGLWAEFRLNTFGVIITLISILPFFFKIIAPGAVIISGYATTKAIGKSAISGPLINIILALILILFLPIVPIPFHIILRNGAYINTLIAFLNLLPFGMFDGYKVISWDKRVWVFVFLTSIILLFVIYIKL
ncbi:MAG: hypothetical protein RMJ31_05990 [Nitrososphaerota archaeon]|nr:hypothetical protein [Nitrososphaerales archaeon]MDW8045304.1 hypothetical protein [Nitrososphaerota archaeon]